MPQEWGVGRPLAKSEERLGWLTYGERLVSLGKCCLAYSLRGIRNTPFRIEEVQLSRECRFGLL